MKLLMRARALGFLSDPELVRCLDALSDAEKRGKPHRLAELLLEKRLLTSGELLVALKGTIPDAPSPSPNMLGPDAFRITDSGVMGELAAYKAAQTMSLKAGERLGDYELLKEVARGGMGVLFEARRRTGVIGQRVALKVLSLRASTSKSLLARFRQEAGLAASLEHPNIIKIHEVAQDRGFHFIVMDYFDGRSLGDLLKTGTLAPKKAVQVIATVAHAVGYMHQRHVVHRDLKPGNILVGAGGRVCITDFGLAKDYARSDVRLTQLGVAVGTPAYMSPEQARGELSAIGPPCDVYSLGATLYRALSGVYPYDADSFLHAVQAIVREDPKPLRDRRPDCPEELEAIVHKAMEREARDRPDARTLAGWLDRYLEDNDILMPPAPPNPKV
jgi:serine/threonine protein kinase